MDKFNIDTPCLILDKHSLSRNLKLMQEQVVTQGKLLRPHSKTHKCTVIAKKQIGIGAVGICATKVSEALILAKNGISNILITSPVVTHNKLKKLVDCRKLDHDLIIVCDSLQNATSLNSLMQKESLSLNVLVDIDPGVGRTGVLKDDALPLASHIHKKCSHLNLLGIQCYAGNLQHVSNYQERKKLSEDVMIKAGRIRREFIEKGLPCEILSGSGTGTYDIDMTVPEVTEVQPGSYTVMDMEYQNIGSDTDANKFDLFKPAMTMLVTVISANHPTHVTVDAGTKAVYFDPNTKPKIISHEGLHYDWSVFGDEHGKVTADSGFELPKVGEVLEMVVPHCDPTINLHDKFHVVEDGKVIDEWPIDMRGCIK